MKIYLDNCCFNRPFDDQSQIKIHIEAQAKLDIQKSIKQGKYDLVWSYILEYENEKCEYFITTDRLLLNKNVDSIKIVNPAQFILEEA